MPTEELEAYPSAGCLGFCGSDFDPSTASGKVQAKAYFANERTFLQWQSIATSTAVLSLALLQIDSESTASGAAIWSLFACVLFLGYALFLFKKRESVIRRNLDYQEVKVGPVVLVGLLVLSFVLMAMYQQHIQPGSRIHMKHVKF
eukprot:CAMPEP_0174331302 /NCGR_PEP_ID=MMETSP0810-20121108/17385_1 /TAXON_ID=73025 ORGANISM="Eutreptiella gymnastica-like, Strain CCMP1594" /NCGR_SAMPLE_ID=MMETSP0810 /ASSEMBLY_ACC=CAM_ASM_000659 /LENGTH=145 /DNA_ID=CAMNT_0015447021 /DNA_START=25 /DNA_END=462 /DNA_ORIENTATION=+